MLLIALFALVPCYHGVSQIEEASGYNRNIAGSLLGGKNSCAVEGRQATAENPFEVAEARLVGLIPMANNATSDLSNATLLWSYSASFPNSVSFPIEGGGGCPQGQYLLHSPSAARFEEGMLRYFYLGNEQEVGLFSNGPNPLSLQLGREGNGTAGFELDGAYALLSARVNGRIAVTYQFRKAAYSMQCQNVENGEGRFCGCQETVESGARVYAQEVEAHRDFWVETGPNSMLWLNPPLQARLEGNESAKVLLFERRMPSKISAYADGKLLGENYPYSFSVRAGSCGEKVVEARFMPDNQGMNVSVGDGSVRPYQLVEKNAAYLPFFLQFGWPQGRGAVSSEILVEDWFSHQQHFGRNFSVRRPEAFSSNQTAAAVATREADGSTSPAAFPPSLAGPGNYPDLSVIAPLLAVGVCLGAYGLVRLAARIGR